jgi:hypothetical protein
MLLISSDLPSHSEVDSLPDGAPGEERADEDGGISGTGKTAESPPGSVRKTIEGHGDVWAAQSALQEARFLLKAAGKGEQDMSEIPQIKAVIDDIFKLSVSQAHGRPQDLEYGSTTSFFAQVNEYFESEAPTVDGEPPDAAKWSEAKAGRLIFSVKPGLVRGLEIDRNSGVIFGYPEVVGFGQFEVTVKNALGAASAHLTLTVAENPMEEALKSPRLHRRLELMRGLDQDAANREEEREKKARLKRFSGPFPAAYQIGRQSHVQTIQLASAGLGSSTRTQLQTMYKDYRLY